MEHGTGPVAKDKRDYDYHKTFGTVSVPAFPENFSIDAGLTMPNQEADGLPFGCTSYTSSDLCTDEDGLTYDDYSYLYHLTPPGTDSEGREMRAALSTICKYGPKNKNGTVGPKRTAYFNIKASGIIDAFDAVRVAIYSTQDEKRGVSAATPWFGGFFGPIASTATFDPAYASWHNHAIKGWKTINGVPYLLSKPWQGPNYGDKGWVYFSREVWNQLMKIDGSAAFTLSKVAPGDIQTVGVEWVRNLVAFLLSLFPPVEPQKPPTETPAPQPPQPPHLSKIPVWALAIQHAEGGKPTDLNIKNHNPGNLKYTTYTASLGGKKGTAGTDGGTFCYFDTYDQGFKALCTFLTDAANNKLRAYKNCTLDQFTTIYAVPPNKNYVNSVASALGVFPNTPISTLL